MKVLDEDNYNLSDKIQIENKEVIISEGYLYRTDFQYGDIVAYRNGNMFGYVYAIGDEEVKVYWMGGYSDWEQKGKLIILPLSKAIELLNWTAKIHRCDSLYWEWVQCVNGNCDIEHIYIKNRAFSKVPFLKGTKDEDKLEDTKFNRRISKYKAVNQYTIYRATCFGKNSSKAFYFIENNDFNNVYFAGIDDQIRTTLWCMYNCDEAELKSSNSYFIPNFLEIPSK